MKRIICFSLIVLAILCRPSKSDAGGIDTIPPTLKLVGPTHDSVLLGNTYIDPGYTVSDNYYKKVAVVTSGTFVTMFKNNFANKPGTYTLIYTAVDSSGNKASVTRYVKVYWNIGPSITLIGPADVNICRFAVYKDLGYKIDTPYFSSIMVDTSGSFLKSGTSVPGLYNISYVAKDTFGNTSISLTRNIFVQQSGSFGCTSSIASTANPLNDIKLFPNPASENINIDPGSQTITNIRVLNELGMLVFEQHSPDTGIFQIPVSQYRSGVYVIIISSRNGTVVRQVVKN